MRRTLAALGISAVATLTACTPWMDVPGLISPRNVVETGNVQRALDQGAVVNVFGCSPGECTVWLAGHRSTHGATFANVTSISVGQTIRYSEGWRIGYYTVTDVEDFCCAGSGYDGPAHDLTLQTSLSNGRLRLVHAQLTREVIVRRTPG